MDTKYGLIAVWPVCVALCGLVRADQIATEEPQPLQAVLPAGATIIKTTVSYNRSGDPICTQDAVYFADINGDGRNETLAFYLDKDEMHLAVIGTQTINGGKELKVLANCAMDGSYFWLDDLSKVAMVVRQREGGGIVIYSATAYGASVRARLVEVAIYSKGKEVQCVRKTLAKDVEAVLFKDDVILYTLRGSPDHRELPMGLAKRPTGTTLPTQNVP